MALKEIVKLQKEYLISQVNIKSLILIVNGEKTIAYFACVLKEIVIVVML